MDRTNVLSLIRLDEVKGFRSAMSEQDLPWVGFDIPRSNAIWLLVALLISLGLWVGIWFAVASFVSWVAHW
jgi:hypothetical protein